MNRSSVKKLSVLSTGMFIFAMAFFGPSPALAASCQANCLFGSCTANCYGGLTPWCVCQYGLFPYCTCLPFTEFLTTEPGAEAGVGGPESEDAREGLLTRLDVFLKELEKDPIFSEDRRQFLDAVTYFRNDLAWRDGPVDPNTLQELDRSARELSVNELETVREAWKRAVESVGGSTPTDLKPAQSFP